MALEDDPVLVARVAGDDDVRQGVLGRVEPVGDRLRLLQLVDAFLDLVFGHVGDVRANALASWKPGNDPVAVLVHGHRDGLADHAGREQRRTLTWT